MTLCIAANVRKRDPQDEAIVCCFDFRIETTTSGSNTGYKFRKINGDWAAMLAGSTSRADRLLDIFYNEFSGRDVSPANAMSEIRKVVAMYRLELVEEYIQSTLSMTYQEYLNTSSKFPDPLFSQIAQQIVEIRQGCSELILFSAKHKVPFIYMVSTDGLVDQMRNFCAIGTGAVNAESWLHFREQKSFDSLEKTILCIYEAKKFAEHAPGVGPTTRLMVIQGDKAKVFTMGQDAERIWNKYGPRPLPKAWSGKFFPDSAAVLVDWEKITT
jgi:hypothetical protein